MTRDDLLDQVIRHEGTGPSQNGRMMPYRDSKGLLTIGFGRNLDANGVRVREARIMLANDVDDAEDACRQHLSWFDDLDSVRQAVLVELCFNMGWRTLSKFVNTLAAVERRDFVAAADGLRKSKWCCDVKEARCTRLARQMETGAYGS